MLEETSGSGSSRKLELDKGQRHSYPEAGLTESETTVDFGVPRKVRPRSLLPMHSSFLTRWRRCLRLVTSCVRSCAARPLLGALNTSFFKCLWCERTHSSYLPFQSVTLGNFCTVSHLLPRHRLGSCCSVSILVSLTRSSHTSSPPLTNIYLKNNMTGGAGGGTNP